MSTARPRHERPDVERLLASFSLEEADRVPHLEYFITSKYVKEYVLGRRLPDLIDPEDDVEFASRIGMDAVGVAFGWRPGNVFGYAEDGTRHYLDGCVKGWDDLEKIGEPPEIEADLGRLEEFFKAAEERNIGVYTSVSSFFDGTYLAMGLQDFAVKAHTDIRIVEWIMDLLASRLSRVVDEVCRYDELSFVFINDDIAVRGGLILPLPLFRRLFVARMLRMIEPAKARNKILTFHTDGLLRDVVPILLELGFSAVHPVEPSANDIFEVKRLVGDKICLVGNIETALLAYGTKSQIAADVKRHVEGLAPGGGYVLGSSTSIFDAIPPENFLAMLRAAQRYGRYPVPRAHP